MQLVICIILSADPGRRAQYSFTCVGPKTCHDIPNPKSKTRNPKFKIQNWHKKVCYITLQNPKFKIQNPKFKIQNSKSKIQNSKSKIQNPKSKIQNQWLEVRGNSVTVPRGQRLESSLARLDSLPVHLCFYSHGAKIVGQT